MINIHQAVDAVKAHLAQFPDLIQTAGLRLEEFDYEDRANMWVVTVSFAEPGGLAALNGTRTYKTFWVDAASGGVKSMRIRNPFAPA